MATLGNILFQGDFSNAQAAADWIIKGAPVYNEYPVMAPSVKGDGWLRFGDPKPVQHGYAISKNGFLTAKNFDIEFTVTRQSCDHGASASGGGFCMALVDASEADAGEGGKAGVNGNDLGYVGMKHAYLGFGLGFETRNGGFFDGFFHLENPSRMPAISPLLGVRGSESSGYKRLHYKPLYEKYLTEDVREPLNIPISRDTDIGREFIFKIRVRPSARSPGEAEAGVSLNGFILLTGAGCTGPLPAKLKLVFSSATERDAFLVGQVKVTDMTAPVPDPDPDPAISKGREAFATGFANRVVYPANFLTDGDWVKKDWDAKADWSGIAGAAPPVSFGVPLREGVLATEIIVVSRQDDPKDAPTDSLTFSKHGASHLQVEYQHVDEDSIRRVLLTPLGGESNNLVVRRYKIDPPARITGVNVIVQKTPDNNTTPLVQLLVIGKKF